MTFKEAKKELRRIGTSRAQGDALRAMYAELIIITHPGLNQHGAPKLYEHLQSFDTEKAITDRSRELLRDGWAASEILFA